MRFDEFIDKTLKNLSRLDEMPIPVVPSKTFKKEHPKFSDAFDASDISKHDMWNAFIADFTDALIKVYQEGGSGRKDAISALGTNFEKTIPGLAPYLVNALFPGGYNASSTNNSFATHYHGVITQAIKDYVDAENTKREEYNKSAEETGDEPKPLLAVANIEKAGAKWASARILDALSEIGALQTGKMRMGGAPVVVGPSWWYEARGQKGKYHAVETPETLASQGITDPEEVINTDTSDIDREKDEELVYDPDWKNKPDRKSWHSMIGHPKFGKPETFNKFGTPIKEMAIGIRTGTPQAKQKGPKAVFQQQVRENVLERYKRSKNELNTWGSGTHGFKSVALAAFDTDAVSESQLATICDIFTEAVYEQLYTGVVKGMPTCAATNRKEYNEMLQSAIKGSVSFISQKLQQLKLQQIDEDTMEDILNKTAEATARIIDKSCDSLIDMRSGSEDPTQGSKIKFGPGKYAQRIQEILDGNNKTSDEAEDSDDSDSDVEESDESDENVEKKPSTQDVTEASHKDEDDEDQPEDVEEDNTDEEDDTDDTDEEDDKVVDYAYDRGLLADEEEEEDTDQTSEDDIDAEIDSTAAEVEKMGLDIADKFVQSFNALYNDIDDTDELEDAESDEDEFNADEEEMDRDWRGRGYIANFKGEDEEDVSSSWDRTEETDDEDDEDLY